MRHFAETNKYGSRHRSQKIPKLKEALKKLSNLHFKGFTFSLHASILLALYARSRTLAYAAWARAKSKKGAEACVIDLTVDSDEEEVSLGVCVCLETRCRHSDVFVIVI